MSAFSYQTMMEDTIIESDSNRVTITECSAQLCKGQDQTYSGTFIDEETMEEGKWAMVMDGHGTDTCIRFLRAIPKSILNTIIGTRTPIESLAKYVNTNARILPNESSGATMCLTKVYTNRIVCINSGDSKLCVFKNSELIFVSTEHTSENESEMARLQLLYPRITFIDSPNIKVISNTQMCGIQSKYAYFKSGLCIASTQSIGHCGKTGYSPETRTFLYEETDVLRIVIGSDGFWDMTLVEEMSSLSTLPCNELLARTENRWKQEWDMYANETTTEFSKGTFTSKMMDDVSVVTIQILERAEAQAEVSEEVNISVPSNV